MNVVTPRWCTTYVPNTTTVLRCTVCGARERCDMPTGTDGMCVPIKRLFVTATKYDGNLGGFVGADAKCNLAAQSVALGGAWKAWIGDSTTPPHTRITDVGPWYNVSGSTRLFNNVANLQTIPLSTYSSDFENEQGAQGSSVAAWSGHGAVSCLSWTSSASTQQGSYLSAGSSTMWQYPSLGCSQPLSIMCLEQ